MSSSANYPPGYDFVLSLMWCIYKHHLLSYLGIGSFPWTMPSLAQPRGGAAGLYEGRVRDYPPPQSRGS